MSKKDQWLPSGSAYLGVVSVLCWVYNSQKSLLDACKKKADPNRFAFVMLLDGPTLPMWQQYVESTIVRVRVQFVI